MGLKVALEARLHPLQDRYDQAVGYGSTGPSSYRLPYASVSAHESSDAVRRALVGRMLAEPGSISEAAATMLPEDLPGPLAVVYTSVLAVYAAGQPLDPIAAGVHLHRRSRLTGCSSWSSSNSRPCANSS
ncbi:hypothetical protein [Streptomyces cyaneofuscatus]|uniref:hypothetical protein n=1 Tax=Streptomyces cyaneofuscatus TaxID=66883 RepID=UPI0033AB0262